MWLSAAATVPLAAFARELGTFTQLGAGTLGQALRAFRQSGEVGDCAPHGVAGQENGVDTLELVDAVQASLAWFASADRALTNTLERPLTSGEGLDVVSLLRGLSSDQLGEAGVTKGELLPILRGEPLTDVQAAALAPVLASRPPPCAATRPYPRRSSGKQAVHAGSLPRLAFYKANHLTDEEGCSPLHTRPNSLSQPAPSFRRARQTGAQSRVRTLRLPRPPRRMTTRTQAADLPTPSRRTLQRRRSRGPRGRPVPGVARFGLDIAVVDPASLPPGCSIAATYDRHSQPPRIRVPTTCQRADARSVCFTSTPITSVTKSRSSSKLCGSKRTPEPN